MRYDKSYQIGWAPYSVQGGLVGVVIHLFQLYTQYYSNLYPLVFLRAELY